MQVVPYTCWQLATSSANTTCWRLVSRLAARCKIFTRASMNLLWFNEVIHVIMQPWSDQFHMLMNMFILNGHYVIYKILNMNHMRSRWDQWCVLRIRQNFWKPKIASVMYYLQHERPCCIGYTNSSRRREFVYLIQHGRECCKWLKKRLILWVHWRSNFKNKRCQSRENQS